EHHLLLLVVHRDALIHILERRPQLHFGALALGDVGEDRNEAAAGNWVAGDLDHGAVRPDPLIGELAPECSQALLTLRLDLDEMPEFAARRDVAQILGESMLAI